MTLALTLIVTLARTLALTLTLVKQLQIPNPNPNLNQVHDKRLVDFDVPAMAPAGAPEIKKTKTGPDGKAVSWVVRRHRFNLANPYHRFAAHRLADIGFSETVRVRARAWGRN